MLFTFSKDPELADDPPLCRIGGELLIDGGNEDFSYLFRSQERYLPYTSMLNKRSLFFVIDETHHISYRDRLVLFHQHLETFEAFFGFQINQIKPFFIPITEDFVISPFDSTSFPANWLGINQLSPMLANVMDQISAKTPTNYDLESAHKVASLVSRFNSKAEYIRLVELNKDADIPFHTPTLILNEDQLFSLSFVELQQEFFDTTNTKCNEFFIKSAMDAGGEISGIITEAGFKDKLILIQEEAGRKNRNYKVEFLIQKRLKASTCVGFSYYITDACQIDLITASGQIYEDEERKEFLGAFISDTLERDIFKKIDENQVKNLCRLFAELGYQGPINFDAIQNENGDFEFVGDCNPRLSAVYPNLAVREFLENQGMAIHSVANLGYRGRIKLKDYSQFLRHLSRMNILFTPDNQAGICIIPSFTGTHNFDFWFINMIQQEIESFIQSNHFQTILTSEECDFQGIYF